MCVNKCSFVVFVSRILNGVLSEYLFFFFRVVSCIFGELRGIRGVWIVVCRFFVFEVV